MAREFQFGIADEPTAKTKSGGEGGIRTPDRGVSPYNGLANRRLQPLGHLSGKADSHYCNSEGAEGHTWSLTPAPFPLMCPADGREFHSDSRAWTIRNLNRFNILLDVAFDIDLF